MRVILVFLLAVFAFGKPLEELVKDVEVSGELHYRYEHNSYKKGGRKRTKVPFATTNPAQVK